LRRLLAYPKINARVSTAEAEAFVALLNESAVMADDPNQPTSPRTADPQDDYLVALAQVSQSFIVSGDKHLLGMVEQFPVYSPASFRRLLSVHGND
jgi:predicted nucleic acid-binding protein